MINLGHLKQFKANPDHNLNPNINLNLNPYPNPNPNPARNAHPGASSLPFRDIT